MGFGRGGEIAGNSHDPGISADCNAVSADYLEAMGARVIPGRLLTETDTADTPKTADQGGSVRLSDEIGKILVFGAVQDPVLNKIDASLTRKASTVNRSPESS